MRTFACERGARAAPVETALAETDPQHRRDTLLPVLNAAFVAASSAHREAWVELP